MFAPVIVGPLLLLPITQLQPKTVTPTKTPPVAAHTASQVLAAARTAIRSEAAVDWTGTERGIENGKAMVVVITTKAGRVDGEQTMTIYATNKLGEAALVVGRVTEIRMGTKLYLEGDQAGLERVDFSPCAAGSEAGRWIAVSSSQALDHEVAVDLTVSTTAQLLAMTAPLAKVTSANLQGKAVVGVRGSVGVPKGVTNQRVVYVRSQGLPLPVELVQGGTYPATAVFGPWGRAPLVRAPKGAVPLKVSWSSTVLGGATCPS